MEDEVASILKSAKENSGKPRENVDFFDPALLKAFADSARSEETRELILDSGLLYHVESSSSMSVELMVEACRLYGNLCFNNPKGRELVKSTKVLDQLHASLRHQPSVITQSKLITVLPAFLQNFCIDNSSNITLVSHLLEMIAAEISSVNQEDSIEVAFLEDFVLVLLEEEDGREIVARPLLQSAAHLIGLAGGSPNVDLMSALTNLSESEKFSSMLLQSNLHTILTNNLQEGLYSASISDDEEKSEKELCSDLLVMTASDASLTDIDTDIIRQWIHKADSDEVLASAALLILGNLCTSDENIDQLITDRTIEDFFSLLSNNNKKIRHSLLGCLRNCCVNMKIRQKLQNGGLAEQMLILSKKDNKPDFLLKTVTILRLLAQNNEDICRQIGSDSTFIKKIVQTGRSGTSFSPTIGQLNVEFARLCSTVVTQSRSEAVTAELVTGGCLVFIVSLLNSSHPVMLNQAVLPLCLVFAGKPVPVEAVGVVTVEMADQLAKVLDNQLLPMEIKQNVVQLINLITSIETKEDIKDIVVASQVGRSLQNYKLKLEEMRKNSEENPESNKEIAENKTENMVKMDVFENQLEGISKILTKLQV